VASVADVVIVSRVQLHASELEPTREDVEDASPISYAAKLKITTDDDKRKKK